MVNLIEELTIIDKMIDEYISKCKNGANQQELLITFTRELYQVLKNNHPKELIIPFLKIQFFLIPYNKSLFFLKPSSHHFIHLFFKIVTSYELLATSR